MSTSSLILPFAVPAEGSGKAFTWDMEVAAVLLLAEAKRGALGFFKAADRKISFVSKLHYPLWFVPWGDGCLVIDGLNVFSASITRKALPDVASFVEDVERGLYVREQFWACLEKHKETFTGFAETAEVRVDALISDRQLLSAIFEYVEEAAPTQLNEGFSAVLVPPKIDVKAALERAKQVLSLYRQVQLDLSALKYAGDLLREAAGFHEKMVMKELEFTREAYEERISKLRPIVEGRVDQLLKELDAEIAKVERLADRKLKAKEREREKLERKLQGLKVQKASFVRRRDLCRRRNDEVGVARWEQKIRICENRIRDAERRIRNLTEFIEEGRRQKEADIEKLQRSYQELVGREKSRISSLEAERDEKIKSKMGEIEALKLATGKIVSQIEELMNREREMERELKELAIPWQAEDISLICLPFYLVGYQAGNKTQLQIFPPFRVTSSKGIMKAFKKTLLGFTEASKVKLFLKPRSNALARMMDFILKKMKADKAFAESLRETAASANILAGQGFRETLIKGLEGLKAEGWVGRKEVDTLIKLYAGGAE